MLPCWATEIRDQCLEAKIPFFFKQWGGRNKKATGRLLDDRTWDELPTRDAHDEVLRWPEARKHAAGTSLT